MKKVRTVLKDFKITIEPLVLKSIFFYIHFGLNILTFKSTNKSIKLRRYNILNKFNTFTFITAIILKIITDLKQLT